MKLIILLLIPFFSLAQKKNKYELKERAKYTLAAGVEAQFTLYDTLNRVLVRKIISTNGTWRITTDKARHSNLIINDVGKTYYLFDNGTWVKK